VKCTEVDTRDDLLGHIMDVIARIKERQDALGRVAKCIDVDYEIIENVLYWVNCINCVT
jgi:hypothetical protein